MYYRSHKWVDTPHTVYERRRELRVRESKHTVMVFDKRYMDIETGKFDTDKLHTLNTDTLANLIDREYNDNEVHCAYSKFGGIDNSYQGLEEQYNAYKFPERQKELLRVQKKKARDEIRLANKKQIEWEKRNQFWAEEYERHGRESENELARQQLIAKQKESELIYLGGANHGQRIITSKWGR